MASGSEQVVSISKAGFAEQIKLLTLPASRGADALQMMLIERDAAVAIAAIESGGSAAGRDGLKVAFPAGAPEERAGGSLQTEPPAISSASADWLSVQKWMPGAPPSIRRALRCGAISMAPKSFKTMLAKRRTFQ